MSATTEPTPSVPAMPAGTPEAISQSVSRRPSVAPEKAPDSTPTSVMPIWTVDRKRPGLAASRKAVEAPECPLSASAFSRAGRDETTASSDMARRPLMQMRTTTTAISTVSMIALIPSAAAARDRKFASGLATQRQAT